MEPFQVYVTCLMAFFISLTCVTFCQFYSSTSPVLFIFRHTYVYKQPILTKQRSYDIFVELLYIYLRYHDRLLDVFFLLFPVILTELHKKPRRGTSFFWQHTLLLMSFFVTFYVHSLPLVNSDITQKISFLLQKMGGRVSALIETFEKGFDMNFAANATKQNKYTNILHNNVLLPLLVVPQSLEIKVI